MSLSAGRTAPAAEGQGPPPDRCSSFVVILVGRRARAPLPAQCSSSSLQTHTKSRGKGANLARGIEAVLGV